MADMNKKLDGIADKAFCAQMRALAAQPAPAGDASVVRVGKFDDYDGVSIHAFTADRSGGRCISIRHPGGDTWVPMCNARDNVLWEALDKMTRAAAAVAKVPGVLDGWVFELSGERVFVSDPNGKTTSVHKLRSEQSWAWVFDLCATLAAAPQPAAVSHELTTDKPETLDEGLERTIREINAEILQPEAKAGTDDWRCFHCDETFADRESAAMHFGTHERQEPACQIDVAKYREMEALQLRYLDEDADVHRAMRRMETEHQQAVRRAEESGYAKGLADAVKYPEDSGLAQPKPAEGSALQTIIATLQADLDWNEHCHRRDGKEVNDDTPVIVRHHMTRRTLQAWIDALEDAEAARTARPNDGEVMQHDPGTVRERQPVAPPPVSEAGGDSSKPAEGGAVVSEQRARDILASVAFPFGGHGADIIRDVSIPMRGVVNTAEALAAIKFAMSATAGSGEAVATVRHVDSKVVHLDWHRQWGSLPAGTILYAGAAPAKIGGDYEIVIPRGCDCPPDAEIGDHANTVELPTPAHMLAVGRIGCYAFRPTTCVDRCVAPLVQALWDRGVVTTGACCGHNVRDGYIGIANLTGAAPAVDAEVREYAENYRWLREQSWYDATICCVMNPKAAVKLGHDCPSGERLDQAIREARRLSGAKDGARWKHSSCSTFAQAMPTKPMMNPWQRSSPRPAITSSFPA